MSVSNTGLSNQSLLLNYFKMNILFYSHILYKKGVDSSHNNSVISYSSSSFMIFFFLLLNTKRRFSTKSSIKVVAVCAVVHILHSTAAEWIRFNLFFTHLTSEWLSIALWQVWTHFMVLFRDWQPLVYMLSFYGKKSDNVLLFVFNKGKSHMALEQLELMTIFILGSSRAVKMSNIFILHYHSNV